MTIDVHFEVVHLMALVCGAIVGGLVGWFVAAVATVLTMDTGPDWVPVLMYVLPFALALAGGWATWTWVIP